LIAVARAADPDEWRDRVGDALERRDRPALAAFLAALRDETVREKIRALRMQIGS